MMNNIQMYRGLKGMSQKDLADSVNMTRPGLSFVENGNSKYIDSEKLDRISEVLGVSSIKLLGMENFKCIPKTNEDIDYMIELLEKIRENL